MKKILLIAALGVAGYYGWQHYQQSGAGIDPVYAEFRVKYSNGIELVGLGRMNSNSDCERRAEQFWKRILVTAPDAEVSPMKCGAELTERYQPLFTNQTIHATYLVLDRGNSGERDGRFIIFGAPSSEVMRVCPTLISNIKKTYTGKVECIQGTVG